MSFLNKLYGSRPKFKRAQAVDPTKEAEKALSGFQGVAPGGAELAGELNAQSQEQLLQRLNKLMPGFSETMSQISGNVARQARGEIPDDVARAIRDAGAAGSAARGFGYGSGQRQNLTARDLGLTSLQLQQQAGSQALQMMQFGRTFGMQDVFSVSQLFVDPMQRAQVGLQNEQFRLQQENLRTMAKAMPDPVISGIHNDFKDLVKTAASVVGGFM